ncbi:MAG: c-type cytochrome biogenesis protein CcmI [Rubrivivax sp.]|nr:c-type cytochrome biogenesis protein CcmI [Rubrivivax sp.]
MTVFWIVAAALVAAVLVVLLRPLLAPARVLTDNTAETNLRVLRAQLAELDGELAAGRLEAEQHAAARAEIERRVIEEGGGGVQARTVGVASAGRGGMVALALVLPVTALALYLHLGNRDAMDPAAAAAAQAQDGHAALQDMESAVARLAQKMKDKPDNAEGWALLGRSYAQLGRFGESRDAYKKALELGREDAQLLSDYVDAMAMAQGRQFSPETDRLLARALALDPNHLKSLALAGTSAMVRGDYATAVKHWTRARENAPPGSELEQGLAGGIAEAQAKAGGAAVGAGSAGAVQAVPPAAPRAAASAAAPAAPAVAAASSAAASAPVAGGVLRVSVALAPALAAKVQPGDTLFVFARAAEGPRMPLAIARLSASALPAQVQLDDAMAMTPQMRLSAFAQVVVQARISKKGNATPEPGDLEGESTPHAPAGALALTIDRVRP